jgi:hypothetical protein
MQLDHCCVGLQNGSTANLVEQMADLDLSRVMISLTAPRADGLSCVICGRNYITSNVPREAVGRSEIGNQVFACAGDCVTEARKRQAG